MSYRDKINKKQVARGHQKVVAVAKVLTAKYDVLDQRFIGGIDTDFWAGPIDFLLGAGRGVQFFGIRAGQNVWEDAQFRRSWTLSRGVKPRFPYWYLDKNASNDGQARKFASLFPNGYDGEGPLCMDMEQEVWIKNKKTGEKSTLTMADCDAFLLALKTYMPTWDGRWILYSGAGWLERHGGTNPKYGNVPLWLANPPPYFGRPDGAFTPYVPKPWRDLAGQRQPLIIQTSFAGDGVYYGTLPLGPGHPASKGIDLDHFMGTAEQFQQLFGVALS